MLHIKTKESVIKRGGACFKFFAETKSLKQKQTFKKKKKQSRSKTESLSPAASKRGFAGNP